MLESPPRALCSSAIRILVATPYPALPLSHGSRVRTFQLAKGLVRLGAEVDIACPWSPGQPLRDYHFEGVRVRPTLFPTLPFLAISDDWLPSAIPIAWEARLPPARSLLRAAASYDIAQFEVSGHGSWIERVPPGVKRVYGGHNVDADFAPERAVRSGPLRRRVAGRVAELERRAVRASDLVLACTDQDVRRFQELYSGDADYAVVPNGFDDELLELDRDRFRIAERQELGLADDELLLLFVGGGAEHNHRAVRVLERDVLPAVRRPARLVVVGKASAALSASSGRVTAIGYVEDMRPLLAAADVGLNPVTYGSGSNVKVAEYLAAGLPVVTTPVGSRGFERWADRMRVVELDGFAGALESPPPAGTRPPGIEELAWGGIAGRLSALYAELL
jgi:glycosyltransferase involved in cell wall biosynthesis